MLHVTWNNKQHKQRDLTGGLWGREGAFPLCVIVYNHHHYVFNQKVLVKRTGFSGDWQGLAPAARQHEWTSDLGKAWMMNGRRTPEFP